MLPPYVQLIVLSSNTMRLETSISNAAQIHSSVLLRNKPSAAEWKYRVTDAVKLVDALVGGHRHTPPCCRNESSIVNW